jgi:hypothetical protein
MSKPRSAHLLGSSRLTILSLSLHVYLDTTGFFVSLSVLGLSCFYTAYVQIAPLLFDTVVTFMTIWKAFTIRRRNGGPSSRLIQTFLREGALFNQPQLFITLITLL